MIGNRLMSFHCFKIYLIDLLPFFKHHSIGYNMSRTGNTPTSMASKKTSFLPKLPGTSQLHVLLEVFDELMVWYRNSI